MPTLNLQEFREAHIDGEHLVPNDLMVRIMASVILNRILYIVLRMYWVRGISWTKYRSYMIDVGISIIFWFKLEKKRVYTSLNFSHGKYGIYSDDLVTDCLIPTQDQYNVWFLSNPFLYPWLCCAPGLRHRWIHITHNEDDTLCGVAIWGQ